MKSYDANGNYRSNVTFFARANRFLILTASGINMYEFRTAAKGILMKPFSPVRHKPFLVGSAGNCLLYCLYKAK